MMLFALLLVFLGGCRDTQKGLNNSGIDNRLTSLVAEYNQTAIPDRRRVLDSILVSVNEAIETSRREIVGNISGIDVVCDDIDDRTGLVRNPNVEYRILMGIEPFFEARFEVFKNDTSRWEAFKLANLDQICPNQVEENLVLMYAVFMQKQYMSMAKKGGGERQYILNKDRSGEEFLNKMLEFKLEDISQGVWYMGSSREFYDVMSDKLFGIDGAFTIVLSDSTMFGDISILPVNLSSPDAAKSFGKFAAFALLEMEPMMVPFSLDVLSYLVGETEPAKDSLMESFCQGFFSLVSKESLSSLSPITLSKFMTGGDVRREFVRVESTSIGLKERIEGDSRMKTSLALQAAAHRGIPIGNTGREIVLNAWVDPNQTEVFKRQGGWSVSLSPDFVAFYGV